MSPWKGLVRSRKFWLLVLDVLISMALFFVGKYAGERVFEDVQFAVLTMQPVFVVIIGAIAYEDAAEKRALQQAPLETRDAARGRSALDTAPRDDGQR